MVELRSRQPARPLKGRAGTGLTRRAGPPLPELNLANFAMDFTRTCVLARMALLSRIPRIGIHRMPGVVRQLMATAVKDTGTSDGIIGSSGQPRILAKNKLAKLVALLVRA